MKKLTLTINELFELLEKTKPKQDFAVIYISHHPKDKNNAEEKIFKGELYFVGENFLALKEELSNDLRYLPIDYTFYLDLFTRYQKIKNQLKIVVFEWPVYLSSRHRANWIVLEKDEIRFYGITNYSIVWYAILNQDTKFISHILSGTFKDYSLILKPEGLATEAVKELKNKYWLFGCCEGDEEKELIFDLALKLNGYLIPDINKFKNDLEISYVYKYPYFIPTIFKNIKIKDKKLQRKFEIKIAADLYDDEFKESLEEAIKEEIKSTIKANVINMVDNPLRFYISIKKAETYAKHYEIKWNKDILKKTKIGKEMKKWLFNLDSKELWGEIYQEIKKWPDRFKEIAPIITKKIEEPVEKVLEEFKKEYDDYREVVAPYIFYDIVWGCLEGIKYIIYHIFKDVS